ncbi:MAG: iron uptake system protein EfeO [Streptosporangiales bacterium]|nr:iron uptake system protein EfeO [Streptosporangiales bacterium]
MRSHRLIAAVAVGLLALASCSSSDGNGDDRKIAVSATDDSCDIADTDLKAGTHTFAVTNDGEEVTEFYVYSGNKVVSEVENIAPGTTRDLTVELTSGDYEGACKPGMKGYGIRSDIKVTGKAKAKTDPKLVEATTEYEKYIATEADELVGATEKFVRLVKAGKAEQAKRLYPRARTHWERIEPVAEIFGDLDPKIDARANDVEPGTKFTGFHKLEKDLWKTKDISSSGPVVDQLLADVRTIVKRAKNEELQPLQLANGSKALLDEVATTKITGEEDRYSHTDLWDFAANVEGSEAAIDALRPALKERDPELLTKLDRQFAKVEKTLAEHRAGDGYELHTELTRAELKEMSNAINALSESVSQVAVAIAK